MRKGISIFLVVTMCFFMFGQFGVMAKNDKEAEKNLQKHTLYMKGAKFKSLKDVKIPFGLDKKDYNNNEKGYYIVRFTGPITENWKEEVKKHGVMLIDYVPDFAFLVEMDNDTKAQIESLPFITETIIYQPFFKLQPDLVDEYGVKKLKDGKTDGEFYIQTFDNDFSSVETIVKNAHGKIKEKNNKTYKVQIYREYLTQIVQLNNVKYIEEVKPYELHNDIARGYIDVDDMELLGYDGTGQIVGVADTGLDTGVNDSSMHLDFQGRIASIHALGRTFDASDPHGHGTHVAGSILGTGAKSNGLYKGMAPGAQLVFQSILDSDGGLGGIPSPLTDLFEQAYNKGARIHNNSWGTSYYEYTLNSLRVDQFVDNNRDMIILIAAGNDGDETTGQCVGSPATAKNCITVGATENYRPEMGETRFGNISDDPNTVAVFSSRGWTEDGRVKPDIVAPGTWIISTKSSMAPDTNFWGTINEYYGYMSGTSMSCPITSGAVAVARQYIVENWNINPSASLMKAVIINGATDLGYGIPEENQGWGRISLTNSLTGHDIQWVNESNDLVTGDRLVHNYTVESSYTPFKITLVWTDYPSTMMTSKELVNDLDLKVTAPDGTVYYGNDFTTPFDSAFDRVNNVENIFIDNPVVGNWKVEVLGYNIPNGPQNYSLVAGGDLGDSITDIIAPTVNITAPNDGAIVSDIVTFSADVSDDNEISKVEFYVDGSFVGRDSDSPYSINWDSATVINGNVTLEAKAYDVAGNVGTSNSITVIVDNPIVTKQFTGFVDKNSTSEANIIIDLITDGDIDLSLTWDSSADMDMYLYDPSGSEVAKAYSTKKPETISYAATTIGQYQIKVKAYSGSGNFTLTATYPGTDVVDTIAPSCSITAPIDGTKVSGTTTISAIASDDVAVNRVEFYVDGSLIGTDTTTPYSVSWNSATVVNGSYIVEAKAYDAASNVGISATSNITVDNFVDTTAPSCSITVPAEGATVSDTITISATASDDVAVDKVEFYVDGSLIGTDTTTPYSISWNSATVVNGSHTVEAKAYDAASNVGTSNAINITVDNFVDIIAPNCSITAPVEGATVSDTITISATANDDVAVDKVEFYVDGSLIGADTTSPYSFDWNTTTVSNGSHTVEVKASDAAGNVGTSTIVNVTVDNGTSTGSEVYTGTVSTSGTDYYEYYINVTESGTIDITLDWIGSGDLDLILYTPSGSWADTSFYSKPETITYNATTTGQYKIKVDAYSGSGDFTLTVTY